MEEISQKTIDYLAEVVEKTPEVNMKPIVQGFFPFLVYFQSIFNNLFKAFLWTPSPELLLALIQKFTAEKIKILPCQLLRPLVVL